MSNMQIYNTETSVDNMQDQSELEVKHVQFLGDDLIAAKDKDGNIWAGISYICNGLGLSKAQKDNQVEKLHRDSVLFKGCRKFPAGVFDPNNDTYALKLDFIPLWLAKINVTPTMAKENPELADKLVQYQLKAKDVLADAFIYRKDKLESLSPEEIMALALVEAQKTLAKREARIVALQNENARLTEKNEEYKTKAEYFDALVDRELNTSFRTTANEFGIRQKVFINWLLEHKYVYREPGGTLLPYARHLEDGLFVVKECKSERNKWAGTQTLITPKGRETFRLLCGNL